MSEGLQSPIWGEKMYLKKHWRKRATPAEMSDCKSTIEGEEDHVKEGEDMTVNEGGEGNLRVVLEEGKMSERRRSFVDRLLSQHSLPTRHLLHARHLSLLHPITRQKLEVRLIFNQILLFSFSLHLFCSWCIEEWSVCVICRLMRPCQMTLWRR